MSLLWVSKLPFGANRCPTSVSFLLSPPPQAFQAARVHSKLPGHVSFKGFETAVLHFGSPGANCGDQLWPHHLKPSKLLDSTSASLPHRLKPSKALPHFLWPSKLLGSTPSCPVMSLLKVSKLPFGTFGSTRASLPHLLQPSKLPGHVCIYS